MKHSSNKAQQDWTLIFLHIPKTAGSTLFAILKRQYPFAFIHPHVGTWKYVFEFKRLPEWKRERIGVLAGHLPFGVHKYLPQPSVYITLLRDPIERAISDYYYVLRTPDNYFYKDVTTQHMSLEEFVASGCNGKYLNLDNGQTRLLSGMVDVGFGQCTLKMLKDAKENLREYFAVVGINERFDETVMLMKKVLGWTTLPYYVRENVTSDRPGKEDIPEDTLKVIEKRNELDLDLYTFAKEMFAEQLCGQDPPFEKELESFKLQNNQSEESQQKETVIFVHIPKTAGTTMWNILREQYDPITIFKCDDFIILRDFQYYVAFVHRLWARPTEQRERINVLGGHIPFGFHKFLCRPSAYFTILRDPIERVVSDYYHLLRSPEHIFYREVTSKNMSLSDYVRSGINQTLDNGQCRFLSGVLNAGYGKCTKEVLEVAKVNLREQFHVVGLAERFDETLILLKRAFGWRAPYYDAVNVTEKRPRKHEIPEETLKVVEAYNELDFELYRYGQELFERLLDQQDSSFEEEVVSFKTANCRRENLVSAETQALTG